MSAPRPPSAGDTHRLPGVRTGATPEVSGTPRVVATALLVTVSLALFLRAVDSLPSLVTGEPRGVRRFRTADEAGQRLGTRPLVPRRIPAVVAWPPSRVRAVGGRKATLEIRADGRDGRPARFLLWQALAAGGELSEVLLPPGEPFHEVPVTVAGRPAWLRSVRVSGAGEYNEIRLEAAGREVLLRLDGPADELLLTAGSLSEAGR